MAKTVAAVVKLIDEFSDPSSTVKKEAKDLEKRFTDVGAKFEAIGGVFDAVGSTLTKKVTAPIVSAGIASIKFSGDSNKAFQQFAAATGTASGKMDRYKELINDVYRNDFGDSIEEVADSMAKVNQNMSYLDDAALRSVTEYAYTLSDTFGVDVAESTRGADALIKNFGISAREAFNLMSQGAQQGLDFSGELFDNIDEYSVQFGKLGFNADDMFNIFASGAKNGAFNLDKIGDAIKEFSIRSIDGSDTTIAGFELIGMNADEMAAKFAAGGDEAKAAFGDVIKALSEMDDPVEQSSVGVKLFGTMWEDLGANVVTNLSAANGSIDRTKESMEELVATKYDTLEGALGGLWRTIQTDVLQPIGNMLIPYVKMGIDKVKELTEWWNKLEPAAQKNIVKFAGIAAAVGPAALGIGKIFTTIGGTINAFGKLGGAIKRAGGIFGMLKSPIGIVTVLATVGFLVYKNWDKITAVFEKVKNKVIDFKNAASAKLTEFKNGIIDTKDACVDFFQEKITSAMDFAKNHFPGFTDSIKEMAEGLKRIFHGVTDFLKGVFTANWKGAWEGVTEIFGGIFQTITAKFKAPMNAVIDLMNSAIRKINSISFTVPEWVPGIGGKGWSGINIPMIPQLAKGTDNWKGGIVQIHEKGGEIVDLPKGSRVYPHDESVRMARDEGARNFYVNIAKLAESIVVREDTDIDRIAQEITRKIMEAAGNMA